MISFEAIQEFRVFLQFYQLRQIIVIEILMRDGIQFQIMCELSEYVENIVHNFASFIKL